MSKYVRWQILLTVLSVVLIAAVLLYIAEGQKTVPVPATTEPLTETVVMQVRGGRYVEGLAGRPQLINPLFSPFNDIDRDLCALIFEGLTTVDQKNDIVPLLADSWEISEDGLIYTFFLRHDVRWQDGTPFTARDVVFTLALLQNPDFPVVHPYAELWKSVSVQQLDDYTVQCTLTEPYAPFLDYTTIGILPQHLLQDVPVTELLTHPFNYAPVGTGLFQIKELDQNHALLATNPYHPQWAETQLDEVEFRFYDSYDHVFAAYQSGEVMGIGHILTKYLDQARADPSLRIHSARLSGYTLVFLNLDRPLFQDLLVRQALLYALDRQGLIDRVLGGQGIVIHSPIMSQSWAYNPQIKQYPYDAQRAVALLEEAGFRLPSFGMDPLVGDQEADVRIRQDQQLLFTLMTDDAPDHIALAREMAKQWAEVGAQVTVQSTDLYDLVRNFLQPREFDAVLLQWPSQLDPDPYPMWHETQTQEDGQNYSGFRDRDASEAIELARQLTDRNARKELYYQFQDIFVEQVPALLLYQPVYTYGTHKQVRNVQIAPLFDPSGRFRTLSQWAVLEKEIPLSDLNVQVGDKLDRRENLWYDSPR